MQILSFSSPVVLTRKVSFTSTFKKVQLSFPGILLEPKSEKYFLHQKVRRNLQHLGIFYKYLVIVTITYYERVLCSDYFWKRYLY